MQTILLPIISINFSPRANGTSYFPSIFGNYSFKDIAIVLENPRVSLTPKMIHTAAIESLWKFCEG